MIRQELKYWAGLVAAAAGAVMAAGVLTHPYDTWVMALCAVCAAIAAYNITPPTKPS